MNPSNRRRLALVAGLGLLGGGLTVGIGQAGFCSAIGPFGNEFVGSRTVAEFNKQAAPTFVANLNRLPDTMSFNFPYSSNDVSVTLTSTIRVSRA